MPRAPPIAPLLVGIALVLVVAMVAFYPRQSLSLTAGTDRITYASGEPVTVSVVLTVGGNAPVSIATGCIPYELGFVVVTDSGEAVYHSLTTELTLNCLRGGVPATLQPGGSESRSFTWGQVDDLGRPIALGHTYVILPALGGTPSVEALTSGAEISVQ